MKRLPLASSIALVALLLACASTPPLPSGPLPAAAVPAAVPLPGSDALLAEGRALREAGDVAGAVARLEEAHAAAPARDDVRIELAELLVADGKELDRAGAVLAGVRRRTVDARWDLASAGLAELRGDDEAAQAAYGRALMVREDPDVRLRRARALERLGRVADAAQELERARSSRPRDTVVRARLAELYEAAGRLTEAETELLGVARAAPERSAGWTQLARFYERNGRTADAEKADAKARATGRPGRNLRPLLPSRR
ncbi:lipopolysaccharide assembly protein LapB [Anaeromyxobacter sp. Fw109-5]|uniref:tetratricopeptide repeat protein n=1 Tax=Anaeromyxobacter sp. (strain Fw109-5) TaxID=404589 RepID=UPI000158A5E4|nr:tetratricopeptide repeat protein [Anaeromyxobacter sp. Fw109-5]ABS25665.1 Tetratricopeptide TPR_2 repeat protein [Anaeromyxobacter sp. Fw109-5]